MKLPAILMAATAVLASSAAVRAEPGVTGNGIVIGGTNAITGPVAAVCYAVTHGANAWLETVNKAGGVHGRTISYTVLDDAYSAQRAVANARRLVEQDQVFAIFGGCGTATAAGVLSYLAGKPEVPYLFPYAGLTELIQPLKPNVFALMPLYDAQLAAIIPAAIAKMNPKPKTAALLSNNIAGAAEWRKVANEIFKAQGIEVVYDDLMEVTSPERAAFVVQLKSKNPELLVVADAAPGAARIFLEMKRQNWKPKLVTGISTLTAEQFLQAVPDVAEGILLAPGVVVPPTDAAAAACNDALKAHKPDIAPNHFSVFGCLTAMVLVEGLNKAGKDLTRANFLRALEGLNNFETKLAGPVSFSATSRMGLDSVIPFEVKDGKFTVVGGPIKPRR